MMEMDAEPDRSDRHCDWGAADICPATRQTAAIAFAGGLTEQTVAGRVEPVRLPTISLTAETLNSFQRDAIRERLRDEHFERYSPPEFGRSSLRLYNTGLGEIETLRRNDGSGMTGPAVATWGCNNEIWAPLQAVSESDDPIIPKIECQTNEFHGERQRHIGRLGREIGDDITIDVIHADRIERAASGKYRYVISNITRMEAQDDGDNRAG